MFADPGTGKTSTTLAAFSALKDSGVADKMLVIAPRRVCQLVWWQESQQWSQFRHLKFAWLHDSRAPWDMEGRPRKKDKELEIDADVYLINPEAVQWLYKKFYDHKRKRADLPFDTVCVDELTKFKNHTAQRSKMLRKLTEKTPRLWGLTGSPTPNGYEDLFGQMLLLDGGAALGWSYSMFRDKHFEPADYMGYSYKLRAGAAERIEAAIRPLVLRIAAEDWLTLPKQIDDPIRVRLDDAARESYNELKKSMLLSVEGKTVTAANAAALYSKLSQLANGAVYLEEGLDGRKDFVHIHDAKLEALDDLVEGLGGAPLLVAYEFNHDLARLQEWYRKRTKKELRFLGKGVKDREVSDIERDWNANTIDVLAVHPASSGHGLNFQKGGAQHICWFSATWDFELYDQLIQRILRQGNAADHVVNHLLLVEDSIDELKYAALADKDQTQARFLQAINTAFDFETPTAGSAVLTKETETMAFEKLKHKAAAQPSVQAAAAPAAKPAPKGWGKVVAAPVPAEDEEPQQAKIAAKLTATQDDEPEAPVNGKAGFSAAVQAKIAGEEEQAEEVPAAKAPRAARTRKADAEPAVVAAPAQSRSINISVEVTYNDNGVPVPKVTAAAYLGGDFEEDSVVRLAELAVATAAAALNRIDGDE